MPRYKVQVTKQFFLTFHVEADDEAEAEQIVNDTLLGDEEEAEKVEADPENGMHFDLSFDEIKEVE